MKKAVLLFMSIYTLLLGLFLFADANMSFVGAIIGVPEKPAAFSLIGGGLIIASAVFLLLYQEAPLYPITYTYRGSHALKKYADEARKNEAVARDLGHLVKMLSKGDRNPGIGSKHLANTRLLYLRGEHGARVWVEQHGDGYEVVAESDKHNEKQVIRKLEEICRRQGIAHN